MKIYAVEAVLDASIDLDEAEADADVIAAGIKALEDTIK